MKTEKEKVEEKAKINNEIKEAGDQARVALETGDDAAYMRCLATQQRLRREAKEITY